MSREHRFGLRHAVLGGLVVFGSVLGVAVVSAPKCQAAPPAASKLAADSGKLAGAVAGMPYTLTIAKVSAVKGKPATAQVVIKPAAGYHINKDFPTSLKLTPPAGVTLAKAELKKADAKLSENEGSFDVTLTAANAGALKIPGELRFAVCTETTCDPQRSSVNIELDVK
mgnify:CR=1 FL=1